MSDWSHGYNVSLGYTYGTYRELAPDWLDFCTRLAGYVAPCREESGAFRYLELGSGQGVGLCMLAAANPDAEFVGIDFNPEHIAHSRSLAISGGLANVRFIEGDFAELGRAWPAELGQFHYVVMHGIYSWIPVPVRQALVDCLARACPPGGLVYNSYNAQPGWVSTMPFQHVARRLQVAGALTGPQAIDAAVKLFESLGEGNGAIFRVLPTLKRRVDSVKTQNHAYLIQEYLHENWHPLWFSEVARELEAAKLNFIGPATSAELLLPGVLPAASRDLVKAQADATLRQEVQDCAINQSFRRDIFCRGARKMFGSTVDGVADTPIHLVRIPPEDVLKIGTSFGDLTINRDIFLPVLRRLEDGPKALGDLAATLELANQGPTGAIQTLVLLMHAGTLAVGRAVPGTHDGAYRFNAALARAVCGGAPYGHVAASATGSAFGISDIDFMLLDTWLTETDCSAEQLASGLSARLAGLGRNLTRGGAALAGAEAEARATALAEGFLANSLPRLRALGAVA